MAWLTSNTGANTVPSSKSVERTLVLALTSMQGVTRRLFQVTTSEITEYRALDEATALSLASNSSYSYDNRTYGDWQPFMLNYIGIRVGGSQSTAAARRANEANGWVLTVTKTSYTTEDV